MQESPSSGGCGSLPLVQWDRDGTMPAPRSVATPGHPVLVGMSSRPVVVLDGVRHQDSHVEEKASFIYFFIHFFWVRPTEEGLRCMRMGLCVGSRVPACATWCACVLIKRRLGGLVSHLDSQMFPKMMASSTMRRHHVRSRNVTHCQDQPCTSRCQLSAGLARRWRACKRRLQSLVGIVRRRSSPEGCR